LDHQVRITQLISFDVRVRAFIYAISNKRG